MFLLISLFCATFLTNVIGNQNCDKFGHLIYEDLGCEPNKIEGEECPRSYRCNFERRNGTCLFRNHYYKRGDAIKSDDLDGSCNVGCFCNDDRVTCAIVDCAEYFGIPQLSKGCYRTYGLKGCCSSGIKCQTEGIEVANCDVDSRAVKEGQIFYPKDSCHKCVCQKGFQGKYETPYCQRTNCANQIRNGDKYLQKCAPYYGSSSDRDVLCCPSSWICPTSTEQIVTFNEKPTDSKLTCNFGEKIIKLGDGFTTDRLRCECSLPPLLTCTDVPK